MHGTTGVRGEVRRSVGANATAVERLVVAAAAAASARVVVVVQGGADI